MLTMASTGLTLLPSSAPPLSVTDGSSAASPPACCGTGRQSPRQLCLRRIDQLELADDLRRRALIGIGQRRHRAVGADLMRDRAAP